MNSHGDHSSHVRYDPQQTKIRLERDELKITERKQNDLIKLLQSKIDQSSDTREQSIREKYKRLKMEHKKSKERYDELRRYLKVLPTRDEYTKLKEGRNVAIAENKYLHQQLESIKETVKEYTSDVNDLKKDNEEKELELRLAHSRIQELQQNSKDEQSVQEQASFEEQLSLNRQLMHKLKQEKSHRAQESARYEENSHLLSSSVKELQKKCQTLQAELETAKNDCQTLKDRVEKAYNGNDPKTMISELSENIDKLDDILRRIELNNESTSYDSNEDLDLTHKQLQRDPENMTMDDLRNRLDELDQRIIGLETNYAANACQVQ